MGFAHVTHQTEIILQVEALVKFAYKKMLY